MDFWCHEKGGRMKTCSFVGELSDFRKPKNRPPSRRSFNEGGSPCTPRPAHLASTPISLLNNVKSWNWMDGTGQIDRLQNPPPSPAETSDQP
jgi:hypothetical protein